MQAWLHNLLLTPCKTTVISYSFIDMLRLWCPVESLPAVSEHNPRIVTGRVHEHAFPDIAEARMASHKHTPTRTYTHTCGHSNANAERGRRNAYAGPSMHTHTETHTHSHTLEPTHPHITRPRTSGDLITSTCMNKCLQTFAEEHRHTQTQTHTCIYTPTRTITHVPMCLHSRVHTELNRCKMRRSSPSSVSRAASGVTPSSFSRGRIGQGMTGSFLKTSRTNSTDSASTTNSPKP